MRPRLLAGFLLIVLGVAALVYQGISYTDKDKVVDIGPIEVTKESTETIPLPPILGVISLVAGIALVATGRKS